MNTDETMNLQGRAIWEAHKIFVRLSIGEDVRAEVEQWCKTNLPNCAQPRFSPPAAAPPCTSPATSEAGAARGGGEPAEEQRCEFCGGSGFFSYNPNLNPNVFVGVASAKCTHCEGTGVMPAISDHGVTEIVQGSAPEPQSAEEWVRRMIVPESDGPVAYSPEHLPSPLALDLARRCDEAEQKAEQLELNAVAFVCGNPCDAHSGSNSPRIEEIVEMSKGCQVCRYREHKDFRAQLAAAERAMRAKLSDHINGTPCEQIRHQQETEDLRAQLAAAQAEARELMKELERVASIYENPEPPSTHEVNARAYDMRCVARAAIAKHAKEAQQ